MDGTTWEQRIHSLTHILTHPATTATAPPLHSQLFISTLIPCYLNWDFPPFLCTATASPPLLLRWSISLFLRRASRLGLPHTSWRSKCPFQLPPPGIISSAVDPAPERWGEEERKGYFRKRRRRRRLGLEVPPVVAFCLPNLLLFTALWWNPLSLRDQKPPPS